MLCKKLWVVITVIVLLGGALFVTSAQAAGPYQAEDAVLGGGATADATFTGYYGSGFVNFPATGGYVEFRNVDGGAGGGSTLRFRFALGATTARTGRLTVNGGLSKNITFNPTGSWTTWAIKDQEAFLTSGTTNTIRLESTGQDLANLDQMEITIGSTPPPTCPPGTMPPPPTPSISVTPTTLAVGGTTQVSFDAHDLGMPTITLWDDSYRIAVFNYQAGVDVYNESPTVRLVSSTASSAVLEAIAAGTAGLKVTVYGEARVGFTPDYCSFVYGFVTVWSSRIPITISAAPVQQAYGGIPWAVPGTIQAEDYDTGGEGVAYHDTTSGNSGGAHRSDDVDIQATTDTGGGNNIGWTAAGEWLEYTVNVAAGGTYTLSARVAAPSAGGSIHAEIDGNNVTGAVAVPATGSWQTWTTVTSGSFSLSAGQHVLRIVEDAAGFNLNWVSLNNGTPPPTTPPPTTNLALGRPVSCSSAENAGTSCANAVDGNLNTRWSSAFSDPQWIQIDLGSSPAISRVVLRWEAAYGRAYQIQISSNGTTWTSIYSTTTGNGGVDDLAISGSGRYIRMFGTQRATGYGYSLWEFEVYGN